MSDATLPRIHGSSTGWTRTAALLVAVGCSNALAVVSLYVPQIVEPQVFSGLTDKPGWLPITAVFLGYSAGNANTAFNLVPLLSRNIGNHVVLLSAALLLTGAAPTMLAFTAACFLTGAGASVAQRFLGMAGQLAGPGRAGNAVAGCIAAALLAILGMRVWGEQLASALGWRTMFVLMSVPFIGWSLLGRSLLGRSLLEQSGRIAPAGTGPAPAQDAPMHVIRLLTRSSVLRRSLAQQAMVFAAYNAAWVLLSAQLAPTERIAASVWGPLAGIVCLLGGGVLIDCGRFRRLHVLGNLAMVLAGCPLLLLAYAGFTGIAGYPGLGSPGALPLGMALIDAGMQLTLVANQVRVQALAPASRGRLASLLTISGSLGGAFGGGLSHFLWQRHGWQAALALVLVTAAGGLLVACVPARTHDPISEAKQVHRAARLASFAFRIQTTASALCCAAYRDCRGTLVNQRND